MVFEKIRESILNHLDVNKHEINMDTDIKKDLGADSLDMMDILIDLEEAYNIEIPDKKLGCVVGDYVHFIEEQTGAAVRKTA